MRFGPGEIGPFERVGVGRVQAGHPLHRRFEMVEAALLDQRGKLGAEAAGARRLVDDDAAAGLLDRRSIVSMSSGTSVRRSITSASMPASSTAASETWTIVP